MVSSVPSLSFFMRSASKASEQSEQSKLTSVRFDPSRTDVE